MTTTAPLSPSARKVEEAALALDLPIRIIEHTAPTRTAEEAAAACGCAVAQIVKSLVFVGAESERPYILLVSGKNRVNEKGIAAVLGEKLNRPNAEFVRDLTGFAIGGIPPFGHSTRLTPVLDPDLLEYETVWAAAGTPNAVFAVAPQALAEATAAAILKVT